MNARGIGEEDRIVWGEVKFDYPEKTVEAKVVFWHVSVDKERKEWYQRRLDTVVVISINIADWG